MTRTAQDNAHQRRFHLRIVATTDLHGAIVPENLVTGEPKQTGLLAAAPQIRDLLAQADGSILVDNGDFFQGDPITDYAEALAPERHPIAEAMNLLPYDAIGLGNHDFDFGLAPLEQAASQLAAPVICTNLAGAEVPAGTQSTAMIERPIAGAAPLQIGIVSVLPPQTMAWNKATIGDQIKVQDMFHAALDGAKALRRAGADLVVALCHGGTGDPTWSENMENPASALAESGSFDAIIAGHTHEVLSQEAPVPLVQPGHGARHIGVVDLWLDPDRKTAASAAQTVPVTSAQKVETPPVIKDLQTKVAAHLNLPIGKAQTPFVDGAAPLGVAPVLRLLAHAKRAAVERHLTTDLPILGVVAPFTREGEVLSIAEGPISRAKAYEVYSYANQLAALEVTGQDLVDWLERSAAAFGRTAGRLLNTQAPLYNFDLIDGLFWTIDRSAAGLFDLDGVPVPAGQPRVTSVQFDGAPLDLRARFVVATNTYRANGGGSFAGALSGQAYDLPKINVRGAFEAQLARGPAQADWTPFFAFQSAAPARMRWRFTAPAGHEDLARQHLPPHEREGEDIIARV